MDQNTERCFISAIPLRDHGEGLKRRVSFKVEDLIGDRNSESCQQRQRSCLVKDECFVHAFEQPLFDDLTNPMACSDSTTLNKEHEVGFPTRRKKSRSSFTVDQLCELEKRFTTQKYLGTKERSEFADKIKLTDTQVKTWFQNRRMKLKRQKREAADRLAKYAILSNFGYGIPAASGIPCALPIASYGGNQNLTPRQPPSLPRVLFDDLYHRGVANQAGTTLPVVVSPYPFSGSAGSFFPSSAVTFHSR